MRKLKVGQRMELRTQVVRNIESRCGGTIDEAPGWDDIVEAVGGNHFTARNGEVGRPVRGPYPSGLQRHPRTNVG